MSKTHQSVWIAQTWEPFPFIDGLMCANHVEYVYIYNLCHFFFVCNFHMYLKV